jgi:hypothetical protein
MPQQTGNNGSSSHGISNVPQSSWHPLKSLRKGGRGIQSGRSNFSYYSSRSRMSNASGRSPVSNKSAFGLENSHQLTRPVPPVEMQKPNMPKGFARGLTIAMGIGNRFSMEGKRAETGGLALPNGQLRGTNGVRGQNLDMLEKRDLFLANAYAQELSSRKGNGSGGNTNS